MEGFSLSRRPELLVLQPEAMDDFTLRSGFDFPVIEVRIFDFVLLVLRNQINSLATKNSLLTCPREMSFRAYRLHSSRSGPELSQPIDFPMSR